MTLENGDKACLARIDERVLNLCGQVTALAQKVEAMPQLFVTIDRCALNQHRHDENSGMNRVERAAKVATLLSIAGAIIFAVLKHV